jgi:hypothetical protein
MSWLSLFLEVSASNLLYDFILKSHASGSKTAWRGNALILDKISVACWPIERP